MTKPTTNVSESKVVMTPRGPRPAAHVHEIPVGGTVRRVGNETHLLDASGNIIHIAPITSPLVRADSKVDMPDEWSSWASYGFYNKLPKSLELTKIVASWTVPPRPTTWSGDPIFSFIEAENLSDLSLQPTLQYGVSAAGGGEYWGMAVWHFTNDGSYYTPLNKNVHSGEVVTAAITIVPGTNRLTASISTHGPGATYVLELGKPWTVVALGLAPNDLRQKLPPSGITFGPIGLGFTGTGAPPDDPWFPIEHTPEGPSIVVEKQGSQDGQIRFYYDNTAVGSLE